MPALWRLLPNIHQIWERQERQHFSEARQKLKVPVSLNGKVMNITKRKQIFNSSGTSNAHVCVCLFSVILLDSQGTPFYTQIQSCKPGGLIPVLICGHHKAQHNQKPGLENSWIMLWCCQRAQALVKWLVMQYLLKINLVSLKHKWKPNKLS